jgi:hypothetical protein
VFEIGGRNKNAKQIELQTNAFRVLDDYVFSGQSNVIPIWMLGFLY